KGLEHFSKKELECREALQTTKKIAETLKSHEKRKSSRMFKALRRSCLRELRKNDSIHVYTCLLSKGKAIRGISKDAIRGKARGMLRLLT
ncbi:MAG: hypothetical protein NDP12_06095, partial [Crenarchaeota archaeon]|nr:hypothetical protein [Thermoproteota archaeon]